MLLQNSSRAILGTVIYSDLFDYPLTKEELFRYQIAPSKLSDKKSISCAGNIEQKNGYFFLKGKSGNIKKRLIRKSMSLKKIVIARRIATILSYIPSIQLIGLSGSVAMENADEADDIDFFVITSSQTIWLTRLLTICILQVLGMRRKRVGNETQNKICINMFLDENNLCIPLKLQNLYTAHEVIQLKPLVIKKDIYTQFLSENIWVRNFLPHAVREDVQYKNKFDKHNENYLYQIGEFFAKHLQLWYMRKHKTREIINDTMLAFHPIDRSQSLLNKFIKRWEFYEI